MVTEIHADIRGQWLMAIWYDGDIPKARHVAECRPLTVERMVSERLAGKGRVWPTVEALWTDFDVLRAQAYGDEPRRC